MSGDPDVYVGGGAAVDKELVLFYFSPILQHFQRRQSSRGAHDAAAGMGAGGAETLMGISGGSVPQFLFSPRAQGCRALPAQVPET